MSIATRMIGLTLVVLMTGCSLAFVKKAPAAATPGPQVACTDSKIMPAADAVIGSAMLIGAVGISRTDTDPDARNVAAPLYGVVGLGMLYSAYVGFRETGRCERLHESAPAPVVAVAAGPAPAVAPPSAPPVDPSAGAVAAPPPVAVAPPPVAVAPPPAPPPVAAAPPPVDPYAGVAPPVAAPPPVAVAPPVAATPPSPPPREPSGEGEMIGIGASLGMVTAITLIDRADSGENKSASLLVVGGALGGGALGYLLADGMRLKRSDAYATGAGLTLGVTNAALLLRPLGRTETSEEVMPILLAGAVVGAGAGLAVGHGMSMTRGQVMFAADLGLLAFASTALTSGMLDEDDEIDNSELLSLQLGLDAGVLAGLVLAPHIDWSYRRARWVGAASLAGFFTGSLLAVGATDKGEDPDPDVVAASVLTGMWAGFGLGVLLTRGWDADATKASPTASSSVVLLPRVGRDDLGVSVAGGF